MVYCVSSLLHDIGTTDPKDTDSSDTTTTTEGTTPSPQTPLACTRERLLHLLGEMNTRPHLRKMLLWPVVVAGIGAEDEVERRFVEGELGWISMAAGTAGGLVARGFLRERAWGLRRGERGWDGVFEGGGGYLFAI